MWRFRFGHPVTGAVTAVVEASQAQVTEAGLVVELDEWGGCKSAKWTGLTGGQQDRARVWIEVRAGDFWRPLFSGVLVRRPSRSLGEREAVGDKYLRLKELPVSSLVTPELGGADVGAEMRRILLEDARPHLPHLYVSSMDLPDAGVKGARRYNGESVAAALDGLLSLKKGWGWTVRADGTVFAGATPARVAVVDAAQPGTKLELRDVVSEGVRTVIRWIYQLPDGSRVAHESQHPRAGDLGRIAVTRYVDKRNAVAMLENVEATYTVTQNDGSERAATADEVQLLRDGAGTAETPALANLKKLTVTPVDEADFVDLAYQMEEVGETEFGTAAFKTVGGPPARLVNTFAPSLSAGASLYVQRSDVSGKQFAVYELNPRRLRRDLLDAAAEALYRIPADHAGTLSVLGIQEPAGSVTVLRPGEPDISEKCVGTRYVLAFPARTEYLIGEPDEPVDAQVLKVLIDRRDEQAIDQAVNT